MIFTVYCLKNIEGDVKYIGMTKQKLRYRLKAHIKDIERNRNPKKCDWIKSLLLNGLEPTIESIYENLSKEIAINREIELIEYYRNIGEIYNISSGGHYYECTEEYKNKMSDSRKGKMMGADNPMYGKKREDLSERNRTNHPLWNEDVKKYVANYFKELYNTPEYLDIHMKSQPNRKNVYQYDLDNNFIKEWESIRQIFKYLKYDMKCIINVCKGRNKKAYNFIWKYKEVCDKVEYSTNAN